MRFRNLAPLLALFLTLGCGNAVEPDERAQPEEPVGVEPDAHNEADADETGFLPPDMAEEIESDQPDADKEHAAEPVELTVADAANAFAVDMYRRLAGEDDGNLFLSPTSIHTALSMTYAGARGQTAEQMEKVLRLPGPEVHAEYAELIAKLNDPAKVRTPERVDGETTWTESPAYELHVANALWPHKDYPFEQDYIELVRRQYRAELEQLDYTRPEPARLRINEWVEDKTNDRIQDLIPQGILNPDTRMVLTNAIYFKSNWAEQFEEHATEDGDFHVGVDETVTAELMNQTDRFGYAETDRLQVLSMPYEANELDMVVILPREVDGLAEIERDLTAEKLSELLGKLERHEVRVTLPKWEFTSEFSLNELLEAMGMPLAFDARNADFSGMTELERLFISAVLHKAFVAVDEEGTEAAAATAVVMQRLAMPVDPPEPKVFRADRPFLFLIRHRETGAVLFMGRVANPAG